MGAKRLELVFVSMERNNERERHISMRPVWPRPPSSEHQETPLHRTTHPPVSPRLDTSPAGQTPALPPRDSADTIDRSIPGGRRSIILAQPMESKGGRNKHGNHESTTGQGSSQTNIHARRTARRKRRRGCFVANIVEGK